VFVVVFAIVWISFENVNPMNSDTNKYTILTHIDSKYKPMMFMYNSSIDLNILQYPLIFKPILCTGLSRGVKVINNSHEANEYLLSCKNRNAILIQEFIPYSIEVGLLYEKNIFTNKGEIISLVQKTSNNPSIMKGCSIDGIECVDLTSKITTKLTSIINAISNGIPNYNIGRYDIKCKSIESLLNGTDFYILEVNVMGNDLRKSYNNMIGSFLNIERWYIARVLRGIKNIITFHGHSPMTLLNIFFLRAYSTVYCQDLGAFICNY